MDLCHHSKNEGNDSLPIGWIAFFELVLVPLTCLYCSGGQVEAHKCKDYPAKPLNVEGAADNTTVRRFQCPLSTAVKNRGEFLQDNVGNLPNETTPWLAGHIHYCQVYQNAIQPIFCGTGSEQSYWN